MHRAATSLTTALPTVAHLAGKAIGWLRRSAAVRSVPGAGGALAVAYGLGQMYHPLFWVALGAFALLIDNRMP